MDENTITLLEKHLSAGHQTPVSPAGFPPEEIAWLQKRVEGALEAYRSLCDLRDDIEPLLARRILEDYRRAKGDVSFNLAELRDELKRLATAVPKP